MSIFIGWVRPAFAFVLFFSLMLMNNIKPPAEYRGSSDNADRKSTVPQLIQFKMALLFQIPSLVSFFLTIQHFFLHLCHPSQNLLVLVQCGSSNGAVLVCLSIRTIRGLPVHVCHSTHSVLRDLKLLSNLHHLIKHFLSFL